jgi:hypothetical protein
VSCWQRGMRIGGGVGGAGVHLVLPLFLFILSLTQVDLQLQTTLIQLTLVIFCVRTINLARTQRYSSGYLLVMFTKNTNATPEPRCLLLCTFYSKWISDH